MTQYQYLVRCEDTSYCILYAKEIVYDGKKPTIEIADRVKFYWEGNTKTVYSGTIIMASGKYSFFLVCFKLASNKSTCVQKFR